MFEFHSDKQDYFNIQYQNSKDSIIPFVTKHIPLDKNIRVLEIGCAEAGVLKSFTEYGCICTGIELSPKRIELAKQFMQKEYESGQISFIARNIYDIKVEQDIGELFDLIILKDVIEHIHEQQKFIPHLVNFLKPGGFVFFGFPPWYMPFGGHQQMCNNKILSHLPYIHLLPMFLYKFILRIGGENNAKIEMLEEIKITGISIERFEKIIKICNLYIVQKLYYLVPPIYKYKFNLKIRKQNSALAKVPYLRDFFTMSAYYLLSINN